MRTIVLAWLASEFLATHRITLVLMFRNAPRLRRYVVITKCDLYNLDVLQLTGPHGGRQILLDSATFFHMGKSSMLMAFGDAT